MMVRPMIPGQLQIKSSFSLLLSASEEPRGNGCPKLRGYDQPGIDLVFIDDDVTISSQALESSLRDAVNGQSNRRGDDTQA
jgi:hypothetical protein